MSILNSVVCKGGCKICGGCSCIGGCSYSGGCSCNSVVIHGGSKYVISGWIECECDRREAERKYSSNNTKYYDSDLIDKYDVVLSIMSNYKKMTNKNLLRDSTLYAAKILKNYEKSDEKNYEKSDEKNYEKSDEKSDEKNKQTKLIPKITSNELFIFAESEIQQIDPLTIKEIYDAMLQLAKFLKIDIDKKPLIKILKLSPLAEYKDISSLEKKMIPYMKKFLKN